MTSRKIPSVLNGEPGNAGNSSPWADVGPCRSGSPRIGDEKPRLRRKYKIDYNHR